jgi:hypothetical protein
MGNPAAFESVEDGDLAQKVGGALPVDVWRRQAEEPALLLATRGDAETVSEAGVSGHHPHVAHASAAVLVHGSTEPAESSA